jgi:hypothetical protein
MKRFWLALAVPLLVGVFGVSVASADTWTDPVGDVQASAPDITAVDVTNDANGTITMVFTVPLSEGSTFFLFVDTNLNGRTDDSVDRVFGAMSFGSDLIVPIVIKDSPIPMLAGKLATTATQATLTFPKADAAIDKGFAFWAVTQSDSQFGTDQMGDAMPNEGMLTYVLTAPPPPPAPPAAVVVKPIIGTPVTLPTTPVAGKRFTVTFPVTRSDNGAPLTVGTMVCDPSVKGKVIAHAESFKSGKARLSFTVPKTAKGKVLKVKVKIISGAQSASKVVTMRIH